MPAAAMKIPAETSRLFNLIVIVAPPYNSIALRIPLFRRGARLVFGRTARFRGFLQRGSFT
jgi:hypothetical protein